MTFLNAKTAFVAFVALTGSFFAMADTAAAQDCRNMKVKGETATYCPYMIRESRVSDALDAGCVRVAFDGIVARELFCPVDLMMGQGTVVAQVAPSQVGTQGNDQTGGGTRPDTDPTPGTGGSSGGNTPSTNGGTSIGNGGSGSGTGGNGGGQGGGTSPSTGNGASPSTGSGTSSASSSSNGSSGSSGQGTASNGGSSSTGGTNGGSQGGNTGGTSSSGSTGGPSNAGGVAGGSSGSWNG